MRSRTCHRRCPASDDPDSDDLHGALRFRVEVEHMGDVVLVCAVPVHVSSAFLREGFDEIEGVRHVDGVHALGQRKRLLQEGTVGMGVLASERRVHDHGVGAFEDVFHIGSHERYVGAERLRILFCNGEGPVRPVVPDDHPRIEEPAPYGEHPGTASQVEDLQSFDVPVAVGFEEDVRRYGRGRHVLFEGDVRRIEPAHLLQLHLELPLPHAGCHACSVDNGRASCSSANAYHCRR